MSVTWGVLAILGVVVAVGSLIQGTIGFGVAVIAAPVTVMLAPSLLPGSVLTAASPSRWCSWPIAGVVAGLVWMPCVLAGYAAAAPLRARVDADRFRRWVLIFCVLASVSVVARFSAGRISVHNCTS